MPMSDVEVLRAACCVAGLDGEVSAEERRLLQALAAKAGVGSVSLQAMTDRARSDPNFYQEQFRLLRADPLEAMATLFRVGVADGVLTDNERIILHHFAERLGLPERDFDRLFQAAEKQLARRQPTAAPEQTRQSQP